MEINVYNILENREKTISGTPAEVENELLRCYPWIRTSDPVERGDIELLVDRLNRDQFFDAEIVQEDQLGKSEGSINELIASMMGHDPIFHKALKAAKFLFITPILSEKDSGLAVQNANGDFLEAALSMYGQLPTQENIQALSSVMDLMGPAKQNEWKISETKGVQPAVEDAEETAASVSRAFDAKQVHELNLEGKHSKGILGAFDPKSDTSWLLKPGSGPQGPSAGDNQDPASQSKREAAFFHVALNWGIGQFIPRTDLLLLDSKEYAAIQLLDPRYKTLAQVKQDGENIRSRLNPYLHGGTLYKWALLDAVLGNVDRHANNIMVYEGDIKLIDHGSAFAGDLFDPAHDKNSFIPYYLRVWAPDNFAQLPLQEKLRYMPQLNTESEKALKSWFDIFVQEHDLDRILANYGVQSIASRDRLKKIRQVAESIKLFEAIYKFWVEV